MYWITEAKRLEVQALSWFRSADIQPVLEHRRHHCIGTHRGIQTRRDSLNHVPWIHAHQARKMFLVIRLYDIDGSGFKVIQVEDHL